MSVTSDLPRLNADLPIFQLTDPLPTDLTITVEDTERALLRLKVNKATGPDNIPAWLLKDFAPIMALPLTAIYNSSLREGVLPSLWKTSYVTPLPKQRPPRSVETDLRPISLTPIAAKVFESLVMKRIENSLVSKVDDNQFGAIVGVSTADALIKITHEWFKATDTPGK